MLKAISSITNALGALNYKGTWNASTNTPTLASSVGTKGDYYVVSVAGSTNLNGETLWGVGDWAVFNGAAWQKVEGGNTINATTVTASTSVTTPIIQVTTLKAQDGTAAGSIANSTGVVTLASSVLTTTDINGGTIDGAAIGASSPSTGAFTTVTFTGGGQTSFFTQSTSGGYVNSMSAASNAGTYYYINWLEGATSRGAITSNGAVMFYGGTSDYRLKENIKPMTSGLERVVRLKPVTYTWKENGKACEGFIAHELQEVVPDAVAGAKDQIDADGNPMYQNIDPRMIVATLTVAIQELKIIVDAQAIRLAALENK
jgi:hypothetical protein